MLCCGVEGLNFNLPKSSDALAKYKKRIAKIQDRYRAIYSMFGGEGETAPDLGEPTIRRPIFACLKRSLKNLPSLYNPEDYNVTKNRDGVFSVNVDNNLIFVRELDSEEPDVYKRQVLRCSTRWISNLSEPIRLIRNRMPTCQPEPEQESTRWNSWVCLLALAVAINMVWWLSLIHILILQSCN